MVKKISQENILKKERSLCVIMIKKKQLKKMTTQEKKKAQ